LVGGDAVLRAQYILSENDPNINNFNNNCSSNQALISAISNETLNEIKLYPNPSNGEIQIKIPDGKLDELYTFEISDITGKLLFKADKYFNLDKIVTIQTNLPDGIYFLNISKENTQLFKSKIVIKK
jgi:hypothetical protein